MNKNLIKQAQQLQTRLQNMQEELADLLVEGSSGGGAVKITMTGKQHVKSVEISKDVADDIEMLQDLITAAMNDASSKSQDLANDKLSSITGGMNIPGMM